MGINLIFYPRNNANDAQLPGEEPQHPNIQNTKPRGYFFLRSRYCGDYYYLICSAMRTSRGSEVVLATWKIADTSSSAGW